MLPILGFTAKESMNIIHALGKSKATLKELAILVISEDNNSIMI